MDPTNSNFIFKVFFLFVELFFKELCLLRVELPSPKIFVNLSWNYKKLHCKRFRVKLIVKLSIHVGTPKKCRATKELVV